MEGTDWLFTAAKISTLSDDDLDATIEYHKAIAGMMLSEREDRRIEKYQKLAKLNITLNQRADVDSTGAVKGTLLTEKQKAENAAYAKSKKKVTVKTVTAPTDANAVMAAIELLLKQGISKEAIAKMFGVEI